MVRWFLILVALLPGVAGAAVSASVDRNRIEINESLTLTLEVEGDAAGEPDLSVLEKDFDILSRNQSSSTTIVNGRVSRSRTWLVSLMPKQTGELEIPPVAIDGETSNPIVITVAPQTMAPPGEADIFLTAEVDMERTWVQAQVIYTVKIFIGVSPRQPRLDQPDFDGVEVLVQPLGDDRRYDSIIDGRTYTVLERRYALFPQASGRLEIGATRFQARLWERGRPTGRKVFTSEPVSVAVLPIPPPPAGHPGAAWLPALDVELSEKWDPATGPVTAGEPVSRQITLRATGLLGNQLPAVEAPPPDGFRAYPDQAELETVAVPEGVQGIRVENYALVGSLAGDARFAPVEVPWWDVRAAEWKVATLPTHALEVLPSAITEPAAEPASPGETMTAPSARDNWWYRVSLVLAGGWLLTLIAWWYTLRARRLPRESKEAPRFRQQARKLKAAREACKNDDVQAATTAILSWAALRWPDRPPRSLGELASLVPEEIGAEFETLNRARYGMTAGSWDGSELAKRLGPLGRAAGVPAEARTTDVLEPLA